MVLRPYPPNLRTEMYLLSISCELIKNRTISSNLVQKWKGDYLIDVVENSKASLYSSTITHLKSIDKFSRVLFSSYVHKVNLFERISNKIKFQKICFFYRKFISNLDESTYKDSNACDCGHRQVSV